MGELQKAVAAARRPAERSYIDDWTDESRARTEEFIAMMRAERIGSTALYYYTNTSVDLPPRLFSNKKRTHTDHIMTYVDSGWVAEKSTSDGPPSHYIILPDTRVLGCDLPGRHPAEQNHPDITRHPYVTTVMPLDRTEAYLFAHDHGLALLAETVQRQRQQPS